MDGNYYVGTYAECLELAQIEEEANGLTLPGIRPNGALDWEHGTRYIRPIYDLGDGTFAYEMEGDYAEAS